MVRQISTYYPQVLTTVCKGKSNVFHENDLEKVFVWLFAWIEYSKAMQY